MHNHIFENQNLKRELIKYKQIFGKIPYIDDALLKGGYRVVRNLKERDAIPYCYRKYGMKVVVIGEEETGLFREYILNSENLLNVWKEVIIETPITEVTEETVDLIEDYSELAEDLETQRDLNLVLKSLILQLQQDIQDVNIPTNTSDLTNDGEDGIQPFITLDDIPAVVVPTKTSDLTNDGEDGENPFITAQDIPAQVSQVNSDWNATEGVAEILNKPTIPAIVPQEQSDWNATSGVSFIKNKPTIPAPIDISGKLDKPNAPNNVPERVVLGDGSTKPLSEITTDISGKVDKPTIDGTWSLQKLGSVFTWVSGVVQNIANTDLSNLSARIFTQGNTFTWNTAGFPYQLKNLLDKSNDNDYNKVLAVNSVGDVVKRDFAELKSLSVSVITVNASIDILANKYTKISTTLINTHSISITLNNPIAGFVNQYILSFDIGGTIPTIIHPAGIRWRYFEPSLRANSRWTIVYETLYNGTSWEVYGTACLS